MAVPLVGVTTLSSAIDVFAAVNKTLVTEGFFFGLFLNRMPSSHPLFPYTPGLSGKLLDQKKKRTRVLTFGAHSNI